MNLSSLRVRDSFSLLSIGDIFSFKMAATKFFILSRVGAKARRKETLRKT
jgi:hypothetical protein